MWGVHHTIKQGLRQKAQPLLFLSVIVCVSLDLLR
jgi:hypothetical protein